MHEPASEDHLSRMEAEEALDIMPCSAWPFRCCSDTMGCKLGCSGPEAAGCSAPEDAG